MKKQHSIFTAALLCLTVLLSLTVPGAAASAAPALRWERGSGGNSADLYVENLDGLRNVYAAQLDLILDGTYESVRISQADNVYSTYTLQASEGTTQLSLYWCAQGDTSLSAGREALLGTLSLDSGVSAPVKATLTLLDWSLTTFFKGEVTVWEVVPEDNGPSWPVRPPVKPNKPDKPEEPEEPEPLPFTDVADGDWFYSAVRYAYEQGLVKGTSATEFSPNGTITRGMFVTILYRLEGEPEAASVGFVDVAPDQWYSAAIDWAAANGIVNGYANGQFVPDGSVTREQMAAILYRYAGTRGLELSADTDLSVFPDQSAVSGYAVDAMKWAVARGLIQGSDDGTLSPQSSATRAQAATILMRFCEGLDK